MGREVRRVPKDWHHPSNSRGHYIPLLGGSFLERLRGWKEDSAQWQKGMRWTWNRKKLVPVDAEDLGQPFEEKPKRADYMPDWTTTVASHYQMYETCTEGTPISPVFAAPEELARWLADNEASAFGAKTASYEAWLRTCRGESAPSAVFSPETGLVSGVEGMHLTADKEGSHEDR